MNPEIEKVLSKFSYGIYLLSCRYEDVNYGMIISWVTQASYDPPLVLASVKRTRRVLPFIEKAKYFSLQVLENTQADLLASFKTPNLEERFAGLSYQVLDTGVPVLTNVLAYVECKLKEIFTPGDHALLVGEIVSGECFKEHGIPLTCKDLGKVYLGKY
ncbi:MAG TPA: flavin reductase [Deltaproteobacteria bacterium]|nr:flavin reductase [Deltaproteobacteria bacterium]